MAMVIPELEENVEILHWAAGSTKTGSVFKTRLVVWGTFLFEADEDLYIFFDQAGYRSMSASLTPVSRRD